MFAELPWRSPSSLAPWPGRWPGERRTLCGLAVAGIALARAAPHSLQQNTHRWTLYLRSFTNEDMSYFIQKVVFQLHPSFGERAKRSTPLLGAREGR